MDTHICRRYIGEAATSEMLEGFQSWEENQYT